MDKNILALKIMAGIPIQVEPKADTIVENSSSFSDRALNKCLTQLINDFDTVVSTSTNREEKTLFNDAASDLEDILTIVKSGKQNKATKLYNELPKKIKTFINTKIDPTKLKSFNEYFSALSESDDYDMSSIDDISIPELSDTTSEPSKYDDIVQCPFCECGNNDVIKSDFYEHIMGEHVEDDIEEPEGFEVDLGSVDGMTSESVEDATVWDKTEDKDESPSSYIVDDSVIKLPSKIKKSLETEIKELQKSSDDTMKTDYNTSEFQNDAANAMIEVLNHLMKETESGMKMAQICIMKYMSPIVQKFPSEVYDFVLHGGYDVKKNSGNSLVSMFKEIKNNKIEKVGK